MPSVGSVTLGGLQLLHIGRCSQEGCLFCTFPYFYYYTVKTAIVLDSPFCSKNSISRRVIFTPSSPQGHVE